MGFIASNPVPLLIGAFAIALAGMVWMFFIRKPKPTHTRYQPAVAITPRQFQSLQYLQAAFPDSAVLLQSPLSNLVSPRKGGKSDATLKAQQALAGLTVDFAICSESGKPSYAFDLDASGGTVESRHARRKATRKNSILKSAGVRLIFLKGSPNQWPTPSEFRLKLALAALQPLSPGEWGLEVYKAPTGSTSQATNSQAQESSIMGMSVLMTLEGDDAEEAWRAARN